MSQSRLDRALEQWSEVLGSDYVITGAAPLRAAETGTFATGHRIPAIVRPSNRAEVQECLRIATRWQVAVYPISGGKNWGYGSACRPPTVALCWISGAWTALWISAKNWHMLPWSPASHRPNCSPFCGNGAPRYGWIPRAPARIAA